jgi:hypothetical protein
LKQVPHLIIDRESADSGIENEKLYCSECGVLISEYTKPWQEILYEEAIKDLQEEEDSPEDSGCTTYF